MQKDIKFIKSFFYELDKNNIKYCILRKAELILEGKAHDIDMVVDFSRISEVYRILEDLSISMGWNKFLEVTKDNKNLISMHYYNIEDNIEIVHFDLFNNFSWNNIIMINNKQLLNKREFNNNVYSCSKENEAITKLFSRYLYHGYIKEEYKSDIVDIFKNYKNEVINTMESFLGYEYSNHIYNLILHKKWYEIEKMQGEIKNKIENNYFPNFNKKLISKVKNIIFKLNRYCNHRGVMIAFLGTDGSGKSTIIEKLPIILGRTFDKTQIKYYHWRPKYIKSPKKDKSSSINVSDPHNSKPYGKLISLLKFMYFNIDYVIGYWLSCKIHLGKNELVVFDRYYYDYLIDKYRYRLDLNDRVINRMMKIIPKPDITFLLIGDPKILYERKQELSIEELENQIVKLNKIKNKISNSVTIDVNKKIDDVVMDVSVEILKYMEMRESKI